MKRVFVALLPLLLVACEEDVAENAIVNYKFTVMSSQQFDFSKFNFEYTRAHRIREDGHEIRTVYLDVKEIEADLTQNESFTLGSSEIEPEQINGFDFGFSPFSVVQNQDTILLKQPSNFDDYTKATLSPAPGETLNITFQLDLDNSIVLDSAGENWIMPKVTVVKK